MGGLDDGGGPCMRRVERRANWKSDVQGWETGERYFIRSYDKFWSRTSLLPPKYK